MGKETAEHVLGRRQFLRAAGASGAVVAPAILLRPGVAGAVGPTPTTAFASSYGWNSTDTTSSLQAALDSAADLVVIDVVSGQSATTWLTKPLFVNRNNFTIIVQAGVTVQAVAGGFPGTSDCLMTVKGRSGVTLLGYGAALSMNKSEYTTGQWRHALSLVSSDSVWVEGVTLSDSGGDGIYIGPDGTADRALYPQYCTNITVKNVVCNNNRRNGMSVTSVEGLAVEGSAFTNSIGNAPEAGVDLEPNSPTTFPNQRIANVTFVDSSMTGNHQCGIDVSVNSLSGSPNPVTVSLERVLVSQNTGQAGIMVTGPGAADPAGNVTVTGSLVYVSQNGGCLGLRHKGPDGMALEFNETVYWHESSITSAYKPIEIDPASSPSTPTDALPGYGGITWHNVSLITNQPMPFLRVVNDSLASDGVSGLDGAMTVADANGVSTDLGAHPHDNTLAVTSLTAGPASTVGVTASTTAIGLGGVSLLTFTRTSSDVSAPLAILYSVAASATAYIDGLPGCAVIPAGASSVILPLRSKMPAYFNWLGSANGGTVTVAITAAGFAYTVGSQSSVTVTIS